MPLGIYTQRHTRASNKKRRTIMPPTRLKLATREIRNFFDLLPKQVFSRRDLSTIFSQQKTAWSLAQGTTSNEFVDFLLQHTKLQKAELKSKTYTSPVRYTWGDASPYLLALSLRKAGYFSHATALVLQGLAEKNSKNIYVNFEQSPKPRLGHLTQESIDRAFANRQRQTNYIFRHKEWRIAVLSGKNTSRLGVITLRTSEADKLDVTNLERTLIDITVRPEYAGGVDQVLKAYESAKQKISVNALMTTLKQLNYIYPYHQAIGFYMYTAGYEESRWGRLKQLGFKYNFYLAHHMGDKTYNSEWCLFHPKRFA
jgi:hypothetical protein